MLLSTALPPNSQRELSNYTNVVLPSGVIPTYFGECLSSKNLKSEEGNRKQKVQRVKDT